MVVTGVDGEIWNPEKNRWEDKDGNPYINGKRICGRCNKPRLDINGVEDCDFCLQGLSVCSFIDFACCGHGDDSSAYISLKDGRCFVLDTINARSVEFEEENSRMKNKIKEYLTEIDYQIESNGKDCLKDSYVRYGRFKQILEELLGETE